MATSIRLVPEIEQRLDFLASRTGRTKAFYLREIIERGLDDMEDYYLAAEVLEQLRRGREKVHSAASVRRDLGRLITPTRPEPDSASSIGHWRVVFWITWTSAWRRRTTRAAAAGC